MQVKQDDHLAHAFLDLALAGVAITLLATVIGVIRGHGVDLALVGAAPLIYGAYLVAARRLGLSPVVYLRNVTKRSSLPR